MREKVLHLILLMSIFIQLPGIIAAQNMIRSRHVGRTTKQISAALRLAAGQETRKEREQLLIALSPFLLEAHG